MKNFSSSSLYSLCLVSLLGSAHAASIDLNFGSVDKQTELNNDGTMSFTAPIANDGTTDIYALIVAETSYTQGGSGGSGSAADDVKINQAPNTTTNFTLTLYQNEELTEVYDPGVSFSYDLFFYDIDGHNTEGDKYYDIVTVYTPSVVTYTTTTELTITNNADGSVTASGINTNGVPGQDGLTSFNQAQADVAASFTFTDTASVNFDYTIVNNYNSGQRNLLIDGGNLTFGTFDTDTTTVTAVPEPSSTMLLGLGSLALILRRRK
ncbi:PEP-CTERM sorting domain-containing protein [Rubritalea spongiae]|uniref:PEP-CTERM sorting domain-containing protein n=1 Tax=Rubritalea spongiae TaxID=430797 RepID=A0ABW5E268_9BACT